MIRPSSQHTVKKVRFCTERLHKAFAIAVMCFGAELSSRPNPVILIGVLVYCVYESCASAVRTAIALFVPSFSTEQRIEYDNVQ